MAGVYWNTGLNAHCLVTPALEGGARAWPCTEGLSAPGSQGSPKWVSEHLGILCIGRTHMPILLPPSLLAA